MRKYTFGLLLLFVIATGFYASSAQAITRFHDTAQWKSLQNYSNVYLFERKDVPASEKTKETYRAEVKLRAAAAKERATSIYRNRIAEKKRKIQNAETAAVLKIKRRLRRQVSFIKKVSNKVEDRYENKYSKVSKKLKRKYAKVLADLNSKLDEIRYKYNRTRKPAKKAMLQEKANQIQSRINVLYRDKKRAFKKLTNRYDNLAEKRVQKFKRKIRKAERIGDRDIRKKTLFWKKKLAASKANIRAQRIKEFDDVATVANRGRSYINQMPVI